MIVFKHLVYQILVGNLNLIQLLELFLVWVEDVFRQSHQTNSIPYHLTYQTLICRFFLSVLELDGILTLLGQVVERKRLKIHTVHSQINRQGKAVVQRPSEALRYLTTSSFAQVLFEFFEPSSQINQSQ